MTPEIPGTPYKYTQEGLDAQVFDQLPRDIRDMLNQLPYPDLIVNAERALFFNQLDSFRTACKALLESEQSILFDSTATALDKRRT